MGIIIIDGGGLICYQQISNGGVLNYQFFENMYGKILNPIQILHQSTITIIESGTHRSLVRSQVLTIFKGVGDMGVLFPGTLIYWAKSCMGSEYLST